MEYKFNIPNPIESCDACPMCDNDWGTCCLLEMQDSATTNKFADIHREHGNCPLEITPKESEGE